MTAETLAPHPGQSITTEPVEWAGRVATVNVECTHSPWSASDRAVAELTLEHQEVRADGLVGEWRAAAKFQADEKRDVPMPPGRYRWQVAQPMGDAAHRRWSVDVSERPRPVKP